MMKELSNTTKRLVLRRATGSITANPNPIQVSEDSRVGVTTLSWASEGTTEVKVHVGAPDGPLFSISGPSGSETTGKWVRNRMVFYLQDVSGGLPLIPAHTLATITVRVNTAEELITSLLRHVLKLIAWRTLPASVHRWLQAKWVGRIMKALWDKGISDEVKFWEQYIATEVLEYKDEYKMRLDPLSLLQENLIIDCLHDIPSDTVSILDVGAGPLTSLGKVYTGKILKITAVDPLADEYDRILKNANIVPPVRTILCYGEQLPDKFEPESFDFAYARNALDHSYDPLLIIKNMLALVKKNGFVLLRHRINEAENQNYWGLHQWNFNIKQNNFIIWNQAVEYNVTQILYHEAQIECYYDGEWIICIINKLS